MSADQAPSGGCENCGGPVRTRKGHGWVCAECEKLLDRQANDRPTPRRLLRLKTIGAKWHAARQAERDMAGLLYAAIVEAVEGGVSEVEAAKIAGVDRMTVRRALGKL
jgi:DNA invertase Pin-like site-specific DNA recombinase